MLFLTDVDHVSFEKANETRQNNLQSGTVKKGKNRHGDTSRTPPYP